MEDQGTENKPSDEFREHGEVLLKMAEALKPLDEEAQIRILRALAEFCGIRLT